MKKIISLLCVVLILCTCAACSNKQPADSQQDNSSTESTENAQGQHKNPVIPTDDLTRFAIKTGELSNYRIAAGYTSDTENIVTIVLHDGKDIQQKKVFYNIIKPDGTSAMDKQEEFRFVWSENAKYIIKDSEEVKTDYTFTSSAAETDVATTIDALTGTGFYNAIIKQMETATYDILHDRYTLDAVEIISGDETLMFDNIYITLDNNYIKMIHCTNETQTIAIELTGINDVAFEGE